jgi:hypothetical protein
MTENNYYVDLKGHKDAVNFVSADAGSRLLSGSDVS